MQIGVTFPQTEIGADPVAIRDYVQAAEAMGYEHLVAFDHVLGADPAQRENWNLYTYKDMFHEPFVLFGYIAAISKLELVSAVIILPQRQTALVAKQATEVDVLTGGKFRLGVGVGWNPVEFEGLNMNFKTRGQVEEEQIKVMRQLWSQEIVTYKGKYHTITAAGHNPLPIHRNIPIWLGGGSEITLKRVARLGDGWFPQVVPDDKVRATLEKLYKYVEEAGRDPKTIGIEARVSTSQGDIDQLARWTEQWRELGATHISINTMNTGYRTLDDHLKALRQYKEAIEVK